MLTDSPDLSETLEASEGPNLSPIVAWDTQECTNTSKDTIYHRLTSLIKETPSYDLWEKRILIYLEHEGSFFCFRSVGDTTLMKADIN